MERGELGAKPSGGRYVLPSGKTGLLCKRTETFTIEYPSHERRGRLDSKAGFGRQHGLGENAECDEKRNGYCRGHDMMMSRRCFLKCASACACSYQLERLSGRGCTFASTRLERIPEKVLRLHNVHTGERLHTRYWVKGIYNQNEMHRIDYLLRCHYTNVVKPIDIKVIDLLCELKDLFACKEEISIISGYRSPQYNEDLRRLGRHVAAGSLHVAGLAIDFAIPGVQTNELSRAAIQLKAGGVGLYTDFVHIDVGRMRHW